MDNPAVSLFLFFFCDVL